ncbi:MAG: TRAP transporter fused permease subunit [Thermodesulfobacteriota bacterium]|nr:TRAP transporter fused permease subunit [Thermodesulfobacteriota bacterium]
MIISERHRQLTGIWWIFLMVFSGLGILLAIQQIFLLKPFGFMLIETAYYYLLLAFYGSLVFIVFPASKTSPKERVPFYDIFLFFLCFGISLYFASAALKIIEKGWEFVAPPWPTALSLILWLLMLEAVRRVAGGVLMTTCFFFSFYPLFAHLMPGFLEGRDFSLLVTARYHAMSVESILGIPMKVVGTLLIGFMIFGVVLQTTGGGKFFINFALALWGHSRGGPAKVAVISSALFGTLSGSVISNVVSTGSMTIPAMKRTGYPAYYAGAVEACASTGGALMPPVMGTAAFIMASFLSIPYWQVCVAAIVPSVLFYLGLFLQTDGYAARVGLQGLDRKELPSISATLKEGWFYLLALFLLIYLLLYLKVEAWAPFYASALLLLLAMTKKETRLSWETFGQLIAGTGKFLAELVAILGAIGLVIGALSVTGVAHSFSRELVAFAGGNVILLLLIGALTSFILGMGMTAAACYIFLAIVLAPALTKSGLNPLAAHLFVLYWGLVSFITPPVALGAITAASIAGANPVKTGFQAMRLGAVIYFIPFFFVFNPALVLQAPLKDIPFPLLTAVSGVFLISGSLEGYLQGLGKLSLPARIWLLTAGMLLAVPEWRTDLIGLGLAGVLIGRRLWQKKKKKMG